MKTRTKILEAAKELFNQQGIANVTLRSLAGHLSISQGNLNYHFKKREDILEELYFEMIDNFTKQIGLLGEVSMDLSFIYRTSRLNMEIMYAYRFIWIDLHQLFRESTKVEKHFLSVEEQRKMGFLFVFNALVEQDIMRKEMRPHEYQHLAERFISYSDFWISSISIYQKELNPAIIEEKHLVLFEMFYPYLTEKGRMEYHKLDENKK